MAVDLGGRSLLVAVHHFLFVRTAAVLGPMHIHLTEIKKTVSVIVVGGKTYLGCNQMAVTRTVWWRCEKQ